MSTTLKDLKQTATSLGVEFHKNITTDKLEAKIEQFYISQEESDSPKLEKDPENDIIKDPENDIIKEKSVVSKTKKTLTIRQIAMKAKKKALKTSVVIVTSIDKRDGDQNAAEYVSCENQYFNVAKLVPMGEKTELEQCLIDVFKDVEMIQHIPEKKNGKTTGNKTSKLVNKFNIHYVS